MLNYSRRFSGAEAMFADLGHFSKLSLRLGFTIVVYPCLVLAYMGEAAYLSKHREDLQSSFYKALPGEMLILLPDCFRFSAAFFFSSSFPTESTLILVILYLSIPSEFSIYNISRICAWPM
jgi:hypothetical protein